ncbi:MAG: sugar ABC transporter permease, partial [Pseudomonadota bacterium]
MATAAAELGGTPKFWEPRWNNWRLALIATIVAIPLTIALLPPNAAFWASFVVAAILMLTIIVNAWGRHNGGLLVAPALGLLFLMNIFPLMWSFGLSFFHFRANRMAPPRFAGLHYYEEILTDPVVWERLQTTALVVVLTVGLQMIIGFLLALLFERKFPGRRILLMLVLTPMMLSFVAVGAFFRYYYEPT